MLEAIFVLIAMFGAFYFVEFVYPLNERGGIFAFFVILVAVFLIIAPGMYSMITGAPFVLTTKKRLSAMIKLGNFKKTDVVYDLGCGDGRIVREVAKCGVKKAIGYEFSFFTFLLAKLRTFLNGGAEEIYFRNFWKEDFTDSTVIVCFLLPKPMEKIKKEIWPKLKKGTRIVSNDAKLPGVVPEKELHKVFLYIKK
ncbi:MAG: class I SAM-dependent methyltransferase [Candidatus Gracilibacteria bacterium]|nr:class I SAM-dependent methyltransferase [Candidatus Gracilibacteria bacterium]